MMILQLTTDQVTALKNSSPSEIVFLTDSNGQCLGTIQPLSEQLEHAIDYDRALKIARSEHPRYTTEQVLARLNQLTAESN